LALAIPRAQRPLNRGCSSPTTTRTGEQETFSEGLKRDLADKGWAGGIEMALRVLKVWMRWPAHLAWLRAIQGPTTRKLLDIYPRIAYRYSLPYLASQFAWDERIQMMTAHYHFLNRVHDASFFEQVLGRGFGLHQWSVDGHAFQLALHGPCLTSRHREGELGLSIQMDGQLLYKLAFSVIPVDLIDLTPDQRAGASELAVYVGHVQGKAGQIDRMREAAGLCHDVAQQDLLMSALAGLAAAWGINRVVGVSDDANLSLAHIARSAASFQYGPFWARYNAVSTTQGHHAMCLPFTDKPITDIAAKHRKRTQTKRQFKQSLSDAVRQVVVGLLTAPKAA
jgi:uncharacterized protein VirK/YbjX